MRKLLLLLPFTASLLINNAFADDYYAQHAMGWHWYNDPKQGTQNTAPQQLFPNQNVSDPVQAMNAIQQAIKRSLDQAILNPTSDNIKNYIETQNQLSNQSSHFSKTWQYVLLQNPNLDYSLTHPTSQIGSQIYSDEQRAKEDAAIRALAQHSGLFFFYKSTCPYCQRFAPTLKDFSERYGITVIPITTDGVALPSFPDSRVDNGQTETFHVTIEPALFTVNPYTHKAIPVSYGLLTEDELRQRMLDITTQFQGND